MKILFLASLSKCACSTTIPDKRHNYYYEDGFASKNKEREELFIYFLLKKKKREKKIEGKVELNLGSVAKILFCRI